MMQKLSYFEIKLFKSKDKSWQPFIQTEGLDFSLAASVFQ